MEGRVYGFLINHVRDLKLRLMRLILDYQNKK